MRQRSCCLKKPCAASGSLPALLLPTAGPLTDIWKGHKFAPDEEHAAALALRAGTDTSCGPEFAALNQALKDKLVTESEIDTAVKRLFTARFRLGMFDPPQDVPYARIPMSEVDSRPTAAGAPGCAGVDRAAQKHKRRLPLATQR